MLDILVFLFDKFYRVISLLDTIVVYENLSLLKILIIVFIFYFCIRFLINRRV